MRTLEELKHTPHLCVIGPVDKSIAPPEAETYHGWVEWDDFKGTVIFGFKENGWEHVSVSHRNKKRLPTWEDMCKLKEMFWGKDVTVCQFHPAEAAYVHGVNRLGNVLHLWRPIDGDFSVITEEMMKHL